MRHGWRKKILCCGFFIVFILIILHPDMNVRGNYEYIEKDVILRNLHEETAANFTSSAVLDCDYRDVIFDDTTLSLSLVDGDLVEDHKIKEGGEYAPSDCKPKFSTAIIVPYRDIAEQLRGFLVYMHMFLHRQCIHYRIYVVEQMDSRPFNKAKLLNIGAEAAMKAGYPCLVLHDVDLLPLRPANLYACTNSPRHMSSSINKFSCYSISIVSKQFRAVNGMSNEFFGLGGEDDDLYARLEAQGIKPCRFEPGTSRYHKVTQESQIRRDRSPKLVKYAKERMAVDGLNTLKFTEVATVLHPLFTHIMVDL